MNAELRAHLGEKASMVSQHKVPRGLAAALLQDGNVVFAFQVIKPADVSNSPTVAPSVALERIYEQPSSASMRAAVRHAWCDNGKINFSSGSAMTLYAIVKRWQASLQKDRAEQRYAYIADDYLESSVRLLPRKSRTDRAKVYTHILQQVEGVTPRISAVLTAQYPTLGDLHAFITNDTTVALQKLANMEFCTSKNVVRRVGPRVADRVAWHLCDIGTGPPRTRRVAPSALSPKKERVLDICSDTEACARFFAKIPARDEWLRCIVDLVERIDAARLNSEYATVILRVDAREKKSFGPLFGKQLYSVINPCDFQIVSDGAVVYAFERKTHNDLASSNRGKGNLHHIQKNRLRANCEAYPTDAVAYVYENVHSNSRYVPANTSRATAIKRDISLVHSSSANTAWRDDFKTIHTEHKLMTVVLLLEHVLAAQLYGPNAARERLRQPLCNHLTDWEHKDAAVPRVDIDPRVNRLNKLIWYRHALRQVPNSCVQMTGAIAKRFPTLGALSVRLASEGRDALQDVEWCDPRSAKRKRLTSATVAHITQQFSAKRPKRGVE